MENQHEFTRQDSTHSASHPRSADNRLKAIPTGLTISGENVVPLIKAGRDTLQRSKTFQTFMESISAPVVGDAAAEP